MAKTYFLRQKEAYSNTLLLVFMYIIGIFAIPIPIAYFVSQEDFQKYYTWITVGCGLCTLILSMIYYFKFSGSGAKIARSCGGISVNDLSKDEKEDPVVKTLIHVVEELSLASGVKMPEIFIVNNNSINAFAAGPADDGAVGVNLGTLRALSRSELSGVLAHEFSHLRNNDNRINILISSLIFGFSFINSLGSNIMSAAFSSSSRTRSNSKNGAGGVVLILLIGFLLYILGLVWIWYSKLLKAAISRQREYLADATAVSYTKDDSIARALVKIQNQYSKIDTEYRSYVKRHRKNSEQIASLSHIFFANPLGLSNLLDSHPPIEKRIKRAKEMSFTLQSDLSSGNIAD